MTEPFDAVLAEVDALARDAAIQYPEADDALHERIRQIRYRLAAAHAAEVAERDARIARLQQGEVGEHVVRLLVAGGFVSQDKATEAWRIILNATRPAIATTEQAATGARDE